MATTAVLPTDSAEQVAQFLRRVFERLSAGASRRHKALKEACKKASDELESVKVSEAFTSQEFDADGFVLPLLLGCEAQVAKLAELSISTLQKLAEYGCLHGTRPDPQNPKQLLIDSVVQHIAGCFELQDATVELQIVKALLTLVTSPRTSVHGNTLLMAMRSCYNIHLVSRDTVVQESAKGATKQLTTFVFRQMESLSAAILRDHPSVRHSDDARPAESSATEISPSLAAAAEEAAAAAEGKTVRPRRLSGESDATQSFVAPESASAAEVAFRDAYMIFRALCKLSLKQIDGSEMSPSIEVRSKILSLDLLNSIMQHPGQVIRLSDKFFASIRSLLIVSALRNSVSVNASIQTNALGIYLSFVSLFKEHLKAEVGVFLTTMLKVLESPNSSRQQKWLILNTLKTQFEDPQFIIDLFLNYDCDLRCNNLFERTVNDLNMLTSAVSAASAHAHHDTTLKYFALEIMVLVTRSIVQWIKKAEGRDGAPDGAGAAAGAASSSAAGGGGPGGSLLSAAAQGSLQSPSVASDQTDKDSESASVTDDTSSFSKRDRQSLLAADKRMIDSPEQFEKLKRLKEILDEGVKRFNKKPKRGIEYLAKQGYFEAKPEQIAQFLQTADGLNKTLVGEYLSEPDEFNLSVLALVVEQMNFGSMEFDDALRNMCQAFRLPGEAQKIDRVMLKFAEHFYRSNPGAFSSADTAYVLAFSTMMLHTDAHSRNVKTKMSKDAWILNNQGIDDNKDLPKEYLERLYDRVVSREIKMRDDDANLVAIAASAGATAGSARQKSQLYDMERNALISHSTHLLRDRQGEQSEFYVASHVEHARMMMEVVWAPLLATFSVMLEESSDEQVVALCLEGFRNSIYVSCVFLMSMERSAFVSALCKFTSLSHVQQMSKKNFDCIIELLLIARTLGNYLQTSWKDVLASISQLERLQLIAAGVKEPMAAAAAARNRQSTYAVESFNALQIATYIPDQDIDKVFALSSRLNADAVVDFTASLCEVSRHEVSIEPPRIFSLQKLVELTAFNMSRIRIVWTRLWATLSPHFIAVGTNANKEVARYAVDSLRQLSVRFLNEQREMDNFQFQSEFLKPFELIFERNRDPSVRDMIVQCIHQIVQLCGQKIRSGWRVVFRVLSLAAHVSIDRILLQAWETLSFITAKLLKNIVPTFVDFVHCISGFADNRVSVTVCLAALRELRAAADALAVDDACKVALSDRAYRYTDSDAHIRVWFPLLTCLPRVISDKRLEVRTEARRILLDILKTHGAVFSPSLWRLIMQGVVLPIFQHVRQGNAPLTREDEEWLETTCFGCMYGIVELFSHYFSRIQHLVSDVLALLLDSMKQHCEALARMAVTCLTHLVCSTGDLLTSDHWTLVGNALESAFAACTPTELLDPSQIRRPSSAGRGQEGGSGGAAASATAAAAAAAAVAGRSVPCGDICDLNLEDSGLVGTRRKAVVQQLLVQMVDDVVAGSYERLSTNDLGRLLGCLQSCVSFSGSYNSNIALSMAIVRAGICTHRPLLLHLESEATVSLLHLLLRLYADVSSERAARHRLCFEPLMSLMSTLFRGVRAFAANTTADLRVYNEALDGFCHFGQDQLLEVLPHLFEPLVDIALCALPDIRSKQRTALRLIGRDLLALNIHIPSLAAHDQPTDDTDGASASSEAGDDEDDDDGGNEGSEAVPAAPDTDASVRDVMSGSVVAEPLGPQRTAERAALDDAAADSTAAAAAAAAQAAALRLTVVHSDDNTAIDDEFEHAQQRQSEGATPSDAAPSDDATPSAASAGPVSESRATRSHSAGARVAPGDSPRVSSDAAPPSEDGDEDDASS